MSKPYEANGYWYVVVGIKRYQFANDVEAWEFYEDNLSK